MSDVAVTPVTTRRERVEFIDLAYRLNASDPNWVPPLRADIAELLDPKKNPFFEHAEAQLFLARRGGRVTGRISAHIDFLQHTLPPEQGMGPGTGNWGMFEAEDEQTADEVERQRQKLRERAAGLLAGEATSATRRR